MTRGISRRRILKGMATTALAPALLPIASAQSSEKPWWLGDGMPQEGARTPKIATAISFGEGSPRKPFAPLCNLASITF